MKNIPIYLNQNTFSHFLENLFDFIMIIGKDGIVKYASESVVNVLGYTSEELTGKGIFKIVYKEDLEKTKQEYFELLAHPDQVQEVDLRIVKKNGSICYVNGKRKNLLTDPDINGILLTVRDITEKKRFEISLQHTENLLNFVEEMSNIGGWEWDIINQQMYWTDQTYKIHGLERSMFEENSKEHVVKSIECYAENDRDIIKTAFEKCCNEGTAYELELKFNTVTGKRLWVKTIGRPVYLDGKIIKVVGNIADITEKKREQLVFDARLLLLNTSYNSSFEEFLQTFLNQAEKLTESSIGFYHLVQDDQETLTLTTWSTNTIKNMCTADGAGSHYNIKDAGVWVDCVREKKPVIHNDYENLKHKKGMPEGHAKVIRELVVPLFRNEKIVAILGVGNKKTDYDENDIQLLYKIADFAWDIAGRKKSEEALKKSEEQARKRNEELNEKNTELKKARQATLNILEDLNLQMEEKIRTETALRGSEEKFRGLYENSSIGIYQTTPEGKILLANPTLIKMLGYNSFEELSELDLETENFAPAYDRSLFKEIIEREGKITGWESAWIKKDGSKVFIRESANLIMDENNQPLYYQGSVEDISERKFAEDKLRESEERFRQLIAQMDQGLAVHEALFNKNGKMTDYRFIELNSSFEKLTGLNRKDVIGKTVLELMPGTEKYWIEKYEMVVNTGDPLHYENYSKELKKYYDVVAYRNQPGQFAVIINDITLKKESELALRESEEKYRVLFETMQNGFYRSTPEGYFVDANPAFIKMLGYANLDELQKVFIPDMVHVTPEHRQKLIKESLLTENVQIYPVKTKSGEIIWLEDHSRFIMDRDGNVMFHEGICSDITERLKIQNALVESEERLRMSLFAANQGLFDMNVQTGEAIINDQYATMLGYDPDTFVETNDLWIQRIHPQDSERVVKTYNDYVEGKIDDYRVEYRERSSDGKWKWILSMGKIVEFTEDNKPLRMLGTHTDIDELKKLEEEKDKLQTQLYQSQKMESVGRLAGGVAHDFNNLLGVILGHSELAMMKLDAQDPLMDNLQEIQKAGEKSTELTKQLLAFARKQTVAPKVLDLNDTIESMLKMIRRLIGEDIELSWIPKPNLWKILLDPTQIDQILANLCVNARDAISDGGKISIETDICIADESFAVTHPGVNTGEYVKLIIQDNGCGMDKETQSKIFEPFFTTKEIGKGSGLGLATVYGIIKQNNGYISVYSEPGEGTTFQVYLPRFVDSESVENEKITTKEIRKGKESILLVEDDLNLLELEKAMLESFGYNVIAVSTPAGALDLISQNALKVDLLITDVIMPGMNGRELVNKISEKFPELKCLYISGYTADVISQHGVLEEGVKFLQKPFSMHQFAEKIRESLG